MAGNTLSPDEAERFRAYELRRHDALADSYEDFFTPVTRLAIDPLLRCVHLAPGQRLLDVATGPGALAAAAADRGAQATGADLSPGMIAIARRLYPSVAFDVTDGEHLPYGDATFDAVVCSFALGHFPYPEAVIAECARVARGGGWIGVSWWDDPSRQRIQGLFREAIAEIGAAPPPDVPIGYSMLRFSETAALQELLAGAGLSEVEVRDHHAMHVVQDVDTLWRGGLGSFAVTASAIAHQDEMTQQAIRASLARRAESYRTPDGLVLPISFKVAAGRK
jgi:SAM-dependent methyltransferase